MNDDEWWWMMMNDDEWWWMMMNDDEWWWMMIMMFCNEIMDLPSVAPYDSWCPWIRCWSSSLRNCAQRRGEHEPIELHHVMGMMGEDVGPEVRANLSTLYPWNWRDDMDIPDWSRSSFYIFGIFYTCCRSQSMCLRVFPPKKTNRFQWKSR